MTAIESALGELNTAWQAASSEMYQASGAPNQGAGAGPEAGGAAGGSGASDNDVSDVEFEEVKDNKK